MNRENRGRIPAPILLAALALPCLACAKPAEGESLPPPLFEMVWAGGALATGGPPEQPWHRVRTKGGNETNYAAAQLQPVLDLRGRFVRFEVKVDDVSRLGGLELRLGSGDHESFFAFALLLYDDPDMNMVRDGVWTPLSFGFGSARVVGQPDRSAIDRVGVYVADDGKGDPVTVSWRDVATLPEPARGYVSFTFDDGYDEHFDAGVWMAEHGLRGTAYVIPESVGQPDYMTLEEVRELGGRYRWEIASHHETPFTEFRPAELERAVVAVQRSLSEIGFSDGAMHLAYPLGRQNEKVVRPLVRRHFATARIAGGGVETLPPADPHLLRVVNITNETTPAEIGAAARSARDNHEWLILMFHHLVPEARDILSYGIEDFRKAVAEVAATGVAVRPVGEVWEACCGSSPAHIDRNERSTR